MFNDHINTDPKNNNNHPSSNNSTFSNSIAGPMQTFTVIIQPNPIPNQFPSNNNGSNNDAINSMDKSLFHPLCKNDSKLFGQAHWEKVEEDGEIILRHYHLATSAEGVKSKNKEEMKTTFYFKCAISGCRATKKICITQNDGNVKEVSGLTKGHSQDCKIDPDKDLPPNQEQRRIVLEALKECKGSKELAQTKIRFVCEI